MTDEDSASEQPIIMKGDKDAIAATTSISIPSGGGGITASVTGSSISHIKPTVYTSKAPITWAPIGASSFTSPKPPELVDLPQRTTRRVLIAFLDDDDEPVWAKRLAPTNMTMDFDSDGSARMNLEVSLVKIYED